MSSKVLHELPLAHSEDSSATLQFHGGIDTSSRPEKAFATETSTPLRKTTLSPNASTRVVFDADMSNLARELKYREFFKRSPKGPAKGFSRFFLSQELNPADVEIDDSVGGEDGFSEHDGERYFRDKPKKPCVSSGHVKNSTHEHANFILAFSKDGKYMASGGDDGVLRIWEVITSPLDREAPDLHHSKSFSSRNQTLLNDEFDHLSFDRTSFMNESIASTENTENIPKGSNTGCPTKKLKKDKHSSVPFAPLFKQSPIKEFIHDDTILSIDWSKNGFIISCSQDSTIKLWHVDRNDCLATFKLTNFATQVMFHQQDDRFFVSCQWDGTVKLWSILEKEVLLKASVKKRITCMAFSPNSQELFLGGEAGAFLILSLKDLGVIAKFEIKKNNVTPRVTGIDVFESNDDIKLLVTANDSRIRLFSYKDEVLNVRYKGHDNEHSTIRASVNEDHSFIISGSEDGWAYIWPLDLFALKAPENAKNTHKLTWGIASLFKDENCRHKNKNYGAFHVHHSRCNVAIFAPRATSKLLELSNDPIFELKARMQNTQVPKKYDDDFDDPSTAIMVTTDDDGIIRVFRRDFAYAERKYYRQTSKKFGSKADRRSSKVRDRSRSSSIMNKSSSIHRGSAIALGDENDRGREEFSRGENLATKAALASFGSDSPLSKTLNDSQGDVSTSDSKMRQLDVRLHDILESTRIRNEDTPIISTADENVNSLRQDIKSSSEDGLAPRKMIPTISVSDQDESSIVDSVITGGSEETKIQCARCGSDKFTARPGGENPQNQIQFFCDDCGKKIDL